MAEPNQSQTGDAGRRRHWRLASPGRYEYHRAPGLVGGVIYWVRADKTWTAELVGMRPANAGGRTIACDAGEFPTPLAAQEWVESAWCAVNAQYQRN